MRRNRIILAAYTFCMLLTSLIPMKYSKGHAHFWTKMDPSLQNFLHVPMFLIFVLFCSRVCREISWCKAHALPASVGAAVFLSVVMESLQIAVPGRYPSSFDIALNLLGSALGCFLVVMIEYKKRRKNADGLRIQ